jgi:hypothetical protein
MAFSQKSITDRAFRIAVMTGSEDIASAIVDNEVVFEDYFSIALSEACLAAAQNESEAAALKRTHDIIIVDGVGDLPDTVLTECMDQSSMVNPADTDTPISFSPRYSDYVSPARPNQLSYYTVEGSNLLFRAVGEGVGESDADIQLTAVSLPDTPALITGTMTIRPETAERVALILAQKVLGAVAGGQ